MPKLLLLALIFVPIGAAAQGAKSLEQLHREDEMQRAMETIDQVEAELNAMIKHREADCSKAVGYRPFCDCLMKDLPVAWSFSEYVAITTRTKEQNGYAKMDKKLRAAYDMVSPIRDKCVKAINAKP